MGVRPSPRCEWFRLKRRIHAIDIGFTERCRQNGSQTDIKQKELVTNMGRIISEWFQFISEPKKSEELGLDFSYPDVWDLLPVTILCGISILFTVLWLLAVWEYVRLKDRQ
jgi:hypothetical protein